MGSGYYAASTALVARTQELDAIANNLANASTVGYRSEHNVFKTVLADTGAASGSSLDRAVNNFSTMGQTVVDLSQGALQKTGNDLDVGIQGSAFFAVKTKTGTVYTRNGSFQMSGNGQLVTTAGDPVMGSGGGPITIPPGPVSIGPDGTISSNGAIAGKLKLVSFPKDADVAPMGNSYYSAPDNAGTDSTDSTVMQGALESSNVNPITAMVELINAQRSAEMMQRSLSLYNTEMDKTATKDLPKVG